MKIALTAIGGLLALSGCIWALQGMGFLPGKLMGGQPQWILYGALAAAAGAGLIYLGNRKPRSGA
jgi:hypothetical protein